MQQKFIELGLLLSDWKCVVSVLMLGYLFIDKEKFSLATFLHIFGVSFNAYIKTIFKIPLNPEIFSRDDGWAFPSGHTQGLAIVLIYVCWHYRKLWVILLSVLMFAYAVVSIEWVGYHAWCDILGGLASACVVFALFVLVKNVLKPSVDLFGLVLLLLSGCILAMLSITSQLNYERFYLYLVFGVCLFVWKMLSERKDARF